MGMSTHIVGIKPPNDRWRAMKAAYDACEIANIDPPDEVLGFFNDEEPDDKGVIVELEDIADRWASESAAGYEINLSNLPNDIKIIRFYNAF